MGIEPRATPEDCLRALAAGDASVLETLARMEVGALARSGLDEESYLLIRLAALVATDAAPVVGSARVLSAASKLALAGLLPADSGRITPSG
jgi:hypothetical protein